MRQFEDDHDCNCRCERDRHLFCAGPKRILALDGGGVRGAVAVAFLEQIQAVLSENLRKPIHFCDWFDLIGGTSTGAIIAAALAMGLTIADLKRIYFELSPKVFKRSAWRIVGLRPKFDARALQQEIESIVGDLKLGSEELVTGFCLVSKRMDTGSPWVLANNPRSKFWESKLQTPHKAGPGYTGNKEYPLANLLRASTAAPSYFDPEEIRIVEGTKGAFLDGAMTPHNNPSLMLFLMAILDAYHLNWKTGPDDLTIVSIGTGSFRHRVAPEEFRIGRTARITIRALASLINDIQQFTLLQMQFLGDSLTPWWINEEVGSLSRESPPRAS